MTLKKWHFFTKRDGYQNKNKMRHKQECDKNRRDYKGGLLYIVNDTYFNLPTYLHIIPSNDL
jgi:hypothetical protein